MLTDQELAKIFSWLPYRDDWHLHGNQLKENISPYYQNLIDSLRLNNSFDVYVSEDGGLGNYLEFLCYPNGYEEYTGNAILLCVSLCAPIAAYGQTTFRKRVDFVGWGGLFSADKIGEIADMALTNIEMEIKLILFEYNIEMLDKDFASRELPVEVAQLLINENHNGGSQYLQGIFQKTD